MDFGAWVQSWLNVLTRPGEPVFEEERIKPHANLTTAAIWVGVVGLIYAVFQWIAGQIALRQFRAAGGVEGIAGQLAPMLEQFDIPPEMFDQLGSIVPMMGTPAFGFAAIVRGLLWAIVGYLVFVALLQLIAKILGGTGNFGKYAYLIATFHVPITLLNGVLGLIPFLGGCVVFLLSIYELVLAYYATRVEHKLPQGKAIMVVLAPVLILALIVCCVVTVFAGAAAAIFGGTR